MRLGERPLIRWLPWDFNLLRSSSVVLTGNGAARLLGFLFYITAARLLTAAEYGTLSYALAILGSASVLLTSSPGGLGRFLARGHDDSSRETFLANWSAVVGLALVASTVLFVLFIPLVGLSAAMLIGVMVNLANIAIFETYVETQRGLERFSVMSGYYALANFLQLAAILVLGAVGRRSAPVFLIAYGFSAIAAAGLMEVMTRTPVAFRPQTIRWRIVLRIARYT
ncbi:MAG: lipopolysaccharide biosynthesis protein, partial [Chloroflexota bacterium]